MFNKRKDTSDAPEQDTQDDTAGPVLAVPEIPPHRTYTVTLTGFGKSEQTTIKGHEVASNAAGMGNMFRIIEYVMHPQLGPVGRTVYAVYRPADAWLEYTETLPEPVEPSRILIPGGSSVIN